jgi:hypothetical protein
VHFCSTSPVGNYWSVTKYNDIVHVDTNAAIFSSDLNLGGVMQRDVDPAYIQWPSVLTLTDDSQISSDLRIWADEENRTNFDRRR